MNLNNSIKNTLNPMKYRLVNLNNPIKTPLDDVFQYKLSDQLISQVYELVLYRLRTEIGSGLHNTINVRIHHQIEDELHDKLIRFNYP